MRRPKVLPRWARRRLHERRHYRVAAAIEDEALNNRLDLSSLGGSPYLAGGTEDWMTYRQRDRR